MEIGCYMTGISTPPNHRVHVISRRLCSGWLRPGLASAHICLVLLTHPTRYRQLLTKGLKRPPFPTRDPKSVPTVPLQPVLAKTHSRQLSPSARFPCRDIFLRFTSMCLISFSAVCPGLLTLQIAISLLPSHLLSPIFSPIFSPFFHPLLTSLPNPSYPLSKTFFSRFHSRYLDPRLYAISTERAKRY
jgi:hypothetical protein